MFLIKKSSFWARQEQVCRENLSEQSHCQAHITLLSQKTNTKRLTSRYIQCFQKILSLWTSEGSRWYQIGPKKSSDLLKDPIFYKLVTGWELLLDGPYFGSNPTNRQHSSFLDLARLWLASKVRSNNGPLAYFFYIFISGKNIVISAVRWQHFSQKWKYQKNM